MLFLDTPEQAIQLIIVCFSFLNLATIFTLSKKNTFARIFGLIFAIPLALTVLGFIYPDMALRNFFVQYLDLIVLTAAVILSLTFGWGFGANIFVTAAYIALVFYLSYLKPALPSFVSSAFFQGGSALLITVLLLFIGNLKVKYSQLPLFGAILILGLMQAASLFYPALSLVLVGVGKAFAYGLFFFYLLKDALEPYEEKVKQAEKVMQDLKKAVKQEVKKTVKEIERHNEFLRSTMQKDTLVDALNRKAIIEYVKNMTDESRDKFTILLFDIDDFKSINDREGHLAGDKVLQKIARIARDNIRNIDVLGRYGGDEFLIVLPGTAFEEALMVAERFRKEVCAQSGSTVSIGLAAYPDDGKTVQELISFADKGMYESKKSGKNSVAHFQGSLGKPQI